MTSIYLNDSNEGDKRVNAKRVEADHYKVASNIRNFMTLLLNHG